MCSGAKSEYSFKTFSTFSSITTDSEIFSPPCTSLCPIASISSKLSITLYSGFVNTDKNKIKLLKSFNASKWQMLRYLIIPSNYHVIISSLKINVGMSLVGVIMGEFLVSKEGIGYLINYGSEVFNLNLVFAGIIILLIVSYLMYLMVLYIEKVLIKNN